MNFFEIETNNILLRVRKERYGCAIYAGENYIKGNHMTFEVLKMLVTDYNLERIISRLTETYEVERAELIEDLKMLFKILHSLGYFSDLYQQLETM